jgi:hypothetical protein
MDWEGVDELLVKRGELLLSLEFLESYDRELKRMNRGKVGRPYMLTERYVEFCLLSVTFSSFLVGSLKALLGR